MQAKAKKRKRSVHRMLKRWQTRASKNEGWKVPHALAVRTEGLQTGGLDLEEHHGPFTS